MRIDGPERYQLTFTPEAFTVLCAKGTNKFSGLSTSDLPKLYIASIDSKPVYVGITKQSVRNRLRLGWNAKGDSGYYGYAWRHGYNTAIRSSCRLYRRRLAQALNSRDLGSNIWETPDKLPRNHHNQLMNTDPSVLPRSCHLRAVAKASARLADTSYNTSARTCATPRSVIPK